MTKFTLELEKFSTDDLIREVEDRLKLQTNKLENIQTQMWGDKVKAKRLEMKLSQQELAKLLNMKQEAVSYAETGLRPMTAQTILKKIICLESQKPKEQQ